MEGFGKTNLAGGVRFKVTAQVPREAGFGTDQEQMLVGTPSPGQIASEGLRATIRQAYETLTAQVAVKGEVGGAALRHVSQKVRFRGSRDQTPCVVTLTALLALKTLEK